MAHTTDTSIAVLLAAERVADGINPGPRKRLKEAAARGFTYRDGPVLVPAEDLNRLLDAVDELRAE